MQKKHMLRISNFILISMTMLMITISAAFAQTKTEIIKINTTNESGEMNTDLAYVMDNDDDDDDEYFDEEKDRIKFKKDMSSEQKNKAKEIREAFVKETKELRSSLKDRRAYLNYQLAKRTVDAKEVEKTMDEVGKLNLELYKKGATYLLKVKKDFPDVDISNLVKKYIKRNRGRSMKWKQRWDDCSDMKCDMDMGSMMGMKDGMPMPPPPPDGKMDKEEWKQGMKKAFMFKNRNGRGDMDEMKPEMKEKMKKLREKYDTKSLADENKENYAYLLYLMQKENPDANLITKTIEKLEANATELMKKGFIAKQEMEKLMMENKK